MVKKETQVKMADMLARHETVIGYLYKTFSQRLLEHKEFWEQLSIEEDSHSFMLVTLKELIEEGKLSFEPREVDLAEVEA